MSTGSLHSPATAVGPLRAGDASRAPVTEAWSAPRERLVILGLAACFAAIAAVTWRKWGMPEIDAGAELTTAELINHGALLYRDVHYYYGPLGIYALALSFKLFGASFSTAYGFGLAQAAAIIATFYALARHWLEPLFAGLSTLVLIAIGFSGSAFNFVLPHTNSATFGLLCLLLMLLAFTRRHLLRAGGVCGLVALTRPEFLAVAIGALAGYLIAEWRFHGRTAARRAAWRLLLPAVAVPLVVLGWFALRIGLGTLITDNLWPVKFVQAATRTESSWMPATVSGIAGLLLRALVYCGLLGSFLLSAKLLQRRRGTARLLGAWPLAATAFALLALDGLLRVSGLFAGERSAIEQELRHLVIGMSWLPALALGVAAVAAVRLLRRGRSPLGGSWPVDLALIVVAAGLGLRAYNAFTAEGSYAPYFAAPLVLLLGIAHARIARWRPELRPATLLALGAVAVGLATYALGALYAHDTTAVHTPRGTFLTDAAAAPALQATVRRIDALTGPGEAVLTAPVDGGLYFMADRRPALPELSLLPGLLATASEQARAIRLLRHEQVTLAVIGAREFSAWGTRTFGVDYDKLLGSYLRHAARSAETVGSIADPVGGTNPARGFTLFRLAR